MPGRGTCGRCGHPTAPEGAFCTECGGPVDDPAFVTCPTCHAATPAVLAFCTECGARVDQATAPTDPPSAAPPAAGRAPTARVPGTPPVHPAERASDAGAPGMPPPAVPPVPTVGRGGRRGLVAGVVAAVLVVVVGVVAVTYVLRSGEGERRAGGAATAAGGAAPGSGAVDEVRRARFSLVVVGCPRGASSEAASVGDGVVLVPDAVVEGASRILLVGGAQPEPAYLLGADEDAGVAVLDVPAVADEGGAAIASADPQDGSKVVVVGAEGHDAHATVRTGEVGSSLVTDRTPANGAVVAGAGGEIAGIVERTGDGAPRLLPASQLTAAKDRHGESSPVEPATCASPAGPSGADVLVAERPAVSGEAAAVVDRLVAYYTAVNGRDLREAHGMRVNQDDYEGFAAGFRSTFNVGMVVGPPQLDGGSATVRISFTSTQNAEHSPDDTGHTCTRWKVTHGMEKRGGSWLVGASRDATYRPCD